MLGHPQLENSLRDYSDDRPNEQAIKGVEVQLGDVQGQLHDTKEMLSAVLCEVRQQQRQ